MLAYSLSFYAKFFIVRNIYVCMYACMYVNIYYSSVYAHLGTYIDKMYLPLVRK